MPESSAARIAPEVVREVASTCLCLHAQRAARALARLFDGVLRPFGLTNQQFSLLMALNRAEPPSIGALALFLAMDRTSLTAALKPLARRGLVAIRAGTADRRSRLAAITPAGVALLAAALPVWRETHARLDAALPGAAQRLRGDLSALQGAAQGLEPAGQAGPAMR